MHVGSVFDTKRSSGGVSLDVIFHTSRAFALFSVSSCSQYVTIVTELFLSISFPSANLIMFHQFTKIMGNYFVLILVTGAPNV